MDYKEYLVELLKAFGEALKISYFSTHIFNLDWSVVKSKIEMMAKDMYKAMCAELGYEFDSDSYEVYMANNNEIHFVVKAFDSKILIKNPSWINHETYHTYSMCLSSNKQAMYLEDSTVLEADNEDCRLFYWLEYLRSIENKHEASNKDS